VFLTLIYEIIRSVSLIRHHRKHHLNEPDDSKVEEEEEEEGPKPMLPYSSMFLLTPTNGYL